MNTGYVAHCFDFYPNVTSILLESFSVPVPTRGWHRKDKVHTYLIPSADHSGTNSSLTVRSPNCCLSDTWMSRVQVCTDYRILGQHKDRTWCSTIPKEMRTTQMERNQAHIHMSPFACSVLSEQPSDLLVAWLAQLKNNDVSLSSTSLAVRTEMIHVQSIRERRCPISILLIMICMMGILPRAAVYLVRQCTYSFRGSA